MPILAALANIPRFIAYQCVISSGSYQSYLDQPNGGVDECTSAVGSEVCAFVAFGSLNLLAFVALIVTLPCLVCGPAAVIPYAISWIMVWVTIPMTTVQLANQGADNIIGQCELGIADVVLLVL